MKRRISSKNTQLLLREREGKYEYVLASDDYIAPTFIETCVKIFEEHPTVSMVMTHRKEVDENGNVKESLPFYNQNCIIPAEEQLGVFMMAGIAIPGHRLLTDHQRVMLNSDEMMRMFRDGKTPVRG